MKSTNHVTLRHLRAALAVARHRSFRRAAEEIHLTGPALSIAIQELERHLGVQLFDRTSRMVRMTDSGAAFLPEAGRLIEELSRLVEDTGASVQSRRGRVVVTCLPSVAARVMPRAIVACRERFPAIEVLVRDDLASNLVDIVRLGEADLGVVVKVSPGAGDLVFEPLSTDRFHAVFLRNHPFAKKRMIKWTELSGQAFVGFFSPSTIQMVVERELKRQGIVVHPIIAVSQLATVHGMLEAGLGVGVLPTLSLPFKEHPLLTHRPLVSPAVSRTIGALRRADRSLSPSAAGFYDVLRDVLASSEPGG